ncbi:FliM/FliN family flagellar motor switch protein [Limnobacter humi]|uniref:FliM/FliN family flagellar motor switch protein n=1 Tax=Limnobacter humi TaxID=1778671 RepID=A0ABT1WET4_9BURK|nr:FliM/FliN family flagellar motor switch protein [Limnobacter humi]MCQ8895551.1 FliM/FliN family flagellar motor switch protein [Limnobacter humi]
MQNQHNHCGDDMCSVIDHLRKIHTTDYGPRTLTFEESGTSFKLVVDTACPKPMNPCKAELVFGISSRLSCTVSRDWFFQQVGISLPSTLISSDTGDHFSALNMLVGDFLQPFLKIIDPSYIGIEGVELDDESSDVDSQTDCSFLELSVFDPVDSLLSDPILNFRISREGLDRIWHSINRKSLEWSRNCAALAPLLRLQYELRLFSWPLRPSDKEHLETGGLLRLIQRTEFDQPILKAVLNAQHQVASHVEIKVKEHEVEFIKDSENVRITEELLSSTHSLSFRLAGENISLADLATLRPGDRLCISSPDWPMVDILSGHEMIGRGELVVFNGEVAVQISMLGRESNPSDRNSESNHAVV